MIKKRMIFTLLYDDGEFVLKQNTKYLIRITSNSDANKVTTALEWYEHTDKD